MTNYIIWLLIDNIIIMIASQITIVALLTCNFFNLVDIASAAVADIEVDDLFFVCSQFNQSHTFNVQYYFYDQCSEYCTCKVKSKLCFRKEKRWKPYEFINTGQCYGYDCICNDSASEEEWSIASSNYFGQRIEPQKALPVPNSLALRNNDFDLDLYPHLQERETSSPDIELSDHCDTEISCTFWRDFYWDDSAMIE